MDSHILSTELSVAPQVSAADLKTLREAGFRSVICNRPDGKGADQSVFEEIERAARDQGMQARYLPAESDKVSDEQGLAFGALMAERPKPVLAFCRTGMRSTTMWALLQRWLDPTRPAAAADHRTRGQGRLRFEGRAAPHRQRWQDARRGG